MMTGEEVVELISEHFNSTLVDVRGSSRRHHHAKARHISMFVIRNSPDSPTLKETGRLFNSRDHSTVLYSLRKAKGYVEHDL